MAQSSIPDPVSKLSEGQLSQLLDAAKTAAAKAYAPYSKFTVGASILLKSGSIVSGCNVENASYSVTICAERVAACTAIADQQLDWKAIVIVSPSGVSPCGSCRQFLSEFAPDLPIYYGRLDSSLAQLTVTSLDILLPAQMRLEDL